MENARRLARPFSFSNKRPLSARFARNNRQCNVSTVQMAGTRERGVTYKIALPFSRLGVQQYTEERKNGPIKILLRDV